MTPKKKALATYRAKRDFAHTPEPSGDTDRDTAGRVFVVQKHWARRLHYDFRLELNGVMKSWAIPKGPSLDPTNKRMAVHVEDHPLSYNTFEGDIPVGHYGAGKVMVWDRGEWFPVGDARQGYASGHLKFELRGEKLHGRWALVRMKGKNERQDPWLLIKEHDSEARAIDDIDVVEDRPESVIEGAATQKPVGSHDHHKKKAAVSPRPVAEKKANPANRITAAWPPVAAVKATLPVTLKPMLATLAKHIPPSESSQNWLYEIKFDGYRLLARIHRKNVRLVTRNGHDWTAKLPHIETALQNMALPDGWYDGEIVVQDSRGVPDFQHLQNAFDTNSTKSIIFYLFDVPYAKGYDLRVVALHERRVWLETWLDSSHASKESVVRFSHAFNARPNDLLASACQLGLEGVMAKVADSHYVSRRTENWIKLKCSRRQEFVIGGFTDPKGTRQGLGALMLGVYDASGALVYAGNAGTGFNDASLQHLVGKLTPLISTTSPFADKPGSPRGVHWVRPRLVAEVAFAEWTDKGHIRQAVFHGLRSDKKAKAIVREASIDTAIEHSAAQKKGASRNASSGKALHSAADDLKITHGDRIIDASSGITKRELIDYYATVFPLMRSHLHGRPVSLVRAQDGVGGTLFFQKHAEHQLAGVTNLPEELDPGHASLLAIDSRKGLLQAAQMNAVEFHTWNNAWRGSTTAFGKPDRMVFDLDPGSNVDWRQVKEAAILVKELLEELALIPFVKTSGGKGLHIIVPLRRGHDWATVKAFSQHIVDYLADTIPTRFVAKSGPRNRVGKIFVDYLRNGFGATTACAWSSRVRPGMGVSVPFAWSELSSIDASDQWTVRNIKNRLAEGNQPWEEYSRSAHGLAAAMNKIGFKKSAT